MNKKDHEDFKTFTKFWISKKVYKKDENKVRGHEDITGKYQGSTHQECNLILSLSKKIPVVFHNLQNYESHLICQEVGKYNLKLLFQKE